MEGYMAEIRGFGGNFAPRTWAFCNGQLLAISSNSALFSLLGTIYGGDGRTSFALPDLRGRIPMHSGRGPGLNTIGLGQRGGAEYRTLTSLNLPSHSHTGTVHVKSGDGAKRQAPGMVLSGDATVSIYSDELPDGTLASSSITLNSAGGNQQFSIQNPYLGINMIICMQGLYPSRS